jgi:O-antigen/teichoic acid export membrane protein
MREVLQRLTKMAFGYGIAQWLGPLIALVMTPILTRILSPADYGIAEYILTLNSAVGILALLGVPQALTTHFNDRNDHAWKARVTGSALALTIPLSATAGLMIFVFAPALAQAAFQNQTYTDLFRLIGATAVLGVVGTVLVTASQSALRVRWGMAFSLTAIVCTLIGNLVYIVWLRLGVTGMLLTPITTGIVISVLAVIIARSLVGPPRWSVMTQLVTSGTLLLPVAVSTWALQMIDRLFLINYVSPTELGYYAIAYKISGLVYIFLAPLFSSWTPLALAMQDDPFARERYASMSRYFVGLALAAVLAMSLFSTEILMILTRPAYLPAAPYAGVLSYVQVISGLGVLLAASALISKQLMALSWFVVVGAAVNLALNFLLIPRFALWGATWATIIGVAVPQVLLYRWLQRRYPIPYPLRTLFLALVVQVVLLVIGLSLPPMPLLPRITTKLVLLLLLPASYVALGIISRFEMEQAGLFIRHRLRMLGLRI